MGIPQADGETASFHLGCEIENAEPFHAVRRDCILVVYDSDVAKSESLNQRLDNLVMRYWTVGFGCWWCGHQC